MRAIWKGAIAFGLVNVPVKVYSATEDHDISLHQVHNADGGRIRYQRRCEVCSQVIDYSDIEILNVIRTGAYYDGEMLAIEHSWNLTEQEAAGIVPYLRSLPPRDF